MWVESPLRKRSLRRQYICYIAHYCGKSCGPLYPFGRGGVFRDIVTVNRANTPQRERGDSGEEGTRPADIGEFKIWQGIH